MLERVSTRIDLGKLYLVRDVELSRIDGIRPTRLKFGFDFRSESTFSQISSWNKRWVFAVLTL